MSIFEIEEDIKRAKTLPSEFYTDPGFFELSKEKIFARSWQFLGRSEQVNTLAPFVMLRGFLDEPVLVVRNGEELNCLSNVCTHRGKVLIDEPCRANLIRCSYHGRRFSLGGKFMSMPEFEGVVEFPSESDDLPSVPFVNRAGFMFASIDPIASFESFVNDAAARLEDVEPAGLHLTGTREYEIDAHWALYCENYLEGFHIPYVHHGLNEIVDYGTYTTETFRYSSLQTGFGPTGEVAARYLFVFPNLMFNFYDWGISVNVVRPVTPGKSIVEFLTYVREGASISDGAGADLHSVELEDEAVVESVQRGIRSRFYKHGRYSPTREQGTHQFHRLIAEFMA
jgi:choline monooxygenase